MEALQSLKAAQISNLAPAFYYIPNFITEEEEATLLTKITSPTSRWTNLTHRRLQVHPAPLTASNILLLPSSTTPSQPASSPSSPLPHWLLHTSQISTRFNDLGVFTHPPTPHNLPNHCLINEYPPGVGIMPHEDGAAYAPAVATVSLGSSTVLEIYDKHNDYNDAEAEGAQSTQGRGRVVARILQEPRSLLVTRGQAYERYLHGINDVCIDEDLGPDSVANWGMLGNKSVFLNDVSDDGSAGEQQKDRGNGERERRKPARNVRGTRISLTFRDVLKVKTMRIGIGGGGGGGGFLRK